jgi:hypothetical protein
MVLMSAPLRLQLDQARREAVTERYERAHGAVERTNGHIGWPGGRCGACADGLEVPRPRYWWVRQS